MPDKVVSIIFQGDDKVTKTIQGITTSMGQLEGVIGGVAGPFARIGDGVLAADAALTALAIGGLTYAYKKSSDLESATAELAKVLGDEIDQLDAAKENALALSNQYGRTSASVLASTAEFKQAGFTVQEAMDLTKASLDLAIAGELDAAQASDLLVASLKGFRAPASSAAELVDILNEVSNEYATNVGELGIAMAGISPIARQMGFSFAETAGLVTPVIEVFRSGSEASRALRTGLLKLTDDTGAVQEALKALGVSQRDVNGNLRSGKEILQDVSQAFTTASEADKLFLTQQLVGIDQSAKMVEVFDNLAKQTAITATATRSAGSAAKEVETRLATAEVSVQRLGVAFENTAAAMGDQFRVAATEAVDGGTEILNVLGELSRGGVFDELFDAIGEYGGELGSFLSGIAEALPDAMESVDWNGLLDALDALVDEFGNLFDGMDLTTAEGLGDAMQAVVDTIESLIRVTQGMVRYLNPVWDSIREGVARFNELDDSSKLAAGEFLGAAELVAKAGTKIGLALVYIEKSGAKIENVFNVVVGSVRTVWNAFQTAFDTIALAVVAALKKVVDAGVEVTKLPFMDEWHQDLLGVQSDLAATGDAIRTHLEEQSEQTLKAMGQVWDGLTGKVRETGDAGARAGEAIQEAFKGTKRGVSDDLSAISKEIEAAVPSEKSMTVQTSLDPAAAKKTEEDVKALSKVIEESVERDLGIIKAETDRYEALLDYRLGALEEQGKTARDVAKSVADSFDASQSALSDLFGNLGEATKGGKGTYFLRQYIEEQQRQAKALADAQARNLEAQARLAQAKAERAESGEAVIQIDGAGLQPHLEAFMYEVLEAIQVRATEEGASFLLGT